jgi:D-arabinose 1-dehydrogenase-like Zn-dependent alcohol dehydrogenase
MGFTIAQPCNWGHRVTRTVSAGGVHCGARSRTPACPGHPGFGTLTQAQELLDLARAKKIAPIPTRNRPLGEAQAALDDLRAGRVVGRTVLTA